MQMYNSKTEEVETKTAAEVYDGLIASINNVYSDVVLGNGFINKANHHKEHSLFDNPFKVIDGPCYAFLVHGRGPAVFGKGCSFCV